MATLRYVWNQYASPLMLLLLLVAVVVGVAVCVGLARVRVRRVKGRARRPIMSCNMPVGQRKEQ